MTRSRAGRAATNSPDGRKLERTIRERVLEAAFSAFRDRGYSETSMLEIATRARVSKRELYALFDHKHAMLAACITERARRIRLPLELGEPLDRQALAATLTAFATAILRGVCEPNVLVVYRLAIAESQRSAQVARVLDSAGREATHAALLELLTKGKKRGLLGAGEPATMTRRFFALLWEDLLVRLLLRVINPPTLKEIERRAREATDALLALYPHPNGSERSR